MLWEKGQGGSDESAPLGHQGYQPVGQVRLRVDEAPLLETDQRIQDPAGQGRQLVLKFGGNQFPAHPDVF